MYWNLTDIVNLNIESHSIMQWIEWFLPLQFDNFTFAPELPSWLLSLSESLILAGLSNTSCGSERINSSIGSSISFCKASNSSLVSSCAKVKALGIWTTEIFLGRVGVTSPSHCFFPKNHLYMPVVPNVRVPKVKENRRN